VCIGSQRAAVSNHPPPKERHDSSSEHRRPTPDHRQECRRQDFWTIESVRTLGTTTDVETAAAILGIGRTKAYELAKAGEFPVKIIRVGRRYIVPIPALLTALDST
jgi:hypothetical protein